MCLITPHKEVKVAEQDMIVYKTLNRNFTSIFQGFEYEFGKEYQTEMQPTDIASHSGFSFYDNLDQTEIMSTYSIKDSISGERVLDKSELICVQKGFHSFKTMFRALHNICEEDEIVVECTIPAGSKYYVGVTNLIASDRIVINRVLRYSDLNNDTNQ